MLAIVLLQDYAQHLLMTFVPQRSAETFPIDVHLLNLYKQNLSVSLRILAQGGDEVDLKDLYKEVEEALQVEKQKVELQKQIILKEHYQHWV